MCSFWRNYKPLSNWENDGTIHPRKSSRLVSFSQNQLVSISNHVDSYFHPQEISGDNVKLRLRTRDTNKFSYIPNTSNIPSNLMKVHSKNSNSDLSKLMHLHNLFTSKHFTEVVQYIKDQNIILKYSSSESSTPKSFLLVFISYLISVMAAIYKNTQLSNTGIQTELFNILLTMEKMFIFPGNLAHFNHLLDETSIYGSISDNIDFNHLLLTFLQIPMLIPNTSSQFSYSLPQLSIIYSFLPKKLHIDLNNLVEQMSKAPTPSLEPQIKCTQSLNSFSIPNQNNPDDQELNILFTDPSKKVQELIAEGYYKAAIKKATDSLKVQPKPSMYIHRAIALKKCNRILEAIADCSEVIKLSRDSKTPQKDPTFIKALKLRASFWLDLGEISSAIKDLYLVVGNDLLKEIMSQSGIRNFDQESPEMQLKLLMNAWKKSQQKSK